MKLRWHLKRQNTSKSRMFCGRNARMNRGTARFTTTIESIFLSNPCKICLERWKKLKQRILEGQLIVEVKSKEK